MARYGYGGYGGGYYGGWAPYVSVAERRRRAMKKMAALRKKGVDVQPVEIEGRKIAHSFWGEGWCEHLESFSDFENRLPRGRTYVRNGSVCHLAIAKGHVEAKVSGSELYDVKVVVKPLPEKKWKAIKGRCSGQIGSLLELLQGRLSDEVMGVVTDRKEGLFPLPGEISFRCSCPDSASMCKHIAAVFYGVGSRLDTRPELLFLLRGVNQEELIQADAEKAVRAATSRGKSKRLAAAEIGDVFGITLQSETTAGPTDPPAAEVAPEKMSARKGPAKKRAKSPAGRRSQSDGEVQPPVKKKAVAKKTSKRRTAQAQ
jgi:uncharacterized Zn finger protein